MNKTGIAVIVWLSLLTLVVLGLGMKQHKDQKSNVVEHLKPAGAFNRLAKETQAVLNGQARAIEALQKKTEKKKGWFGG